MMKSLFILMFSLFIEANFYVAWRVWTLVPFGLLGRVLSVSAILLALGCLFISLSGVIEQLPMELAVWGYGIGTTWIVLLLYLTMVFLLADIAYGFHLIPSHWVRHSWIGSIVLLVLMSSIFGYGYWKYNQKARVSLDIVTDKKLERPLTIVLLSDLHLGYHNRASELERWINMINKENPDLVLIGGDIIDRSIRPLVHDGMEEMLRQINASVFACLGNHEYYASPKKSEEFYKKADIHLLRDETVSIDGIDIIGRDDRTNGRRKSLESLMRNIQASRFTILLDHQPFHLEEAEARNVDFQFSGHTHYGQVWPISWIEDAIYELAYGKMKKGNTLIYVSSGMGIWGGKYRIGTQSEYVVLKLHN